MQVAFYMNFIESLREIHVMNNRKVNGFSKKFIKMEEKLLSSILKAMIKR